MSDPLRRNIIYPWKDRLCCDQDKKIEKLAEGLRELSVEELCREVWAEGTHS